MMPCKCCGISSLNLWRGSSSSIPSSRNNSRTSFLSPLPSPLSPHSFSVVCPFRRASKFRMEVVRCKINQSHNCIWKENGSCIIEDVEANRYISISDDKLRWTQSAISKLLRTPIDRFFKKYADIDRGRLKVSKFQAKFRVGP